jgi:hypothetical protein
MGNATRSGDRYDRSPSIMRIGRTLHISLSFKGLHLSSECRRMSSDGVGEVAHPHRTVVNDLAQHRNRSNADSDTRTNSDQTIKSLASSDTTQRSHFLAQTTK